MELSQAIAALVTPAVSVAIEAWVAAIGRLVAGPIASAVATCHVPGAAIAMHLAAAPGDLMAGAHAAARAAARAACPGAAEDSVEEAEEAGAAAVVVAGAGKRRVECEELASGVIEMKPVSAKGRLSIAGMCAAAAFALYAVGSIVAQPTASATPTSKPSPASSAAPRMVSSSVRAFASPQQAADALVKAAGDYDETALAEIFGPDGRDIVFTGEYAQDREHAARFADAAKEKMSVTTNSAGNKSIVVVGNEEWPFPVPIVKGSRGWTFDSKVGRQELLFRRIGANELDAIQVCDGYVEAQEQYALQPREGYSTNQYAQRIISSPNMQDGLAWQNADGSWGGPIGEKIAKAIEQDYSPDVEPYHGYLFKILKGQGPAAPLGQMNYVIKDVMIGGFALVAAPAEYGVTGVQTFIVSQDGVVYQKDIGPGTLDAFRKMDLFNPDISWTPVAGREQADAAQ